MMRGLYHTVFLLLVSIGTAAAETSLNELMEQADFQATIGKRGEGALLEQSTAVEQARIQARSRSEYGLELRPSVSDNDVGMALRIYLPDRWSKQRLHEQLTLAARSEQLRIAALEWKQVVSVYRDFSSYRLLDRQRDRIIKEQRYIEPILARADKGVELNQLTVSDRARLYSAYLGLINDLAGIEAKRIEIRGRLKSILGPEANLDRLAAVAVIEMPSQLEVGSLLERAMSQRADIQKITADFRAMQLAEETARTEDGFRIKYLQPSYNIDYTDGSTGWELSTSIVLPWGTRNPDIALYQAEQTRAAKALVEERRMTRDRLSVLLETAQAYYALFAERNRQTLPLKKQLEEDLALMAGFPLDQVRDALSIHLRMLDADLLDTEARFRMENTAIDLAEELGDI